MQKNPKVDNSSIEQMKLSNLTKQNAELRLDNAELEIENAQLKLDLERLMAEWNPPNQQDS